MAGLQSISSAFLDAVKNLWNGSENRVKEEPIIDTLSYLKEMDYDLYGYGYLDVIKEIFLK